MKRLWCLLFHGLRETRVVLLEEASVAPSTTRQLQCERTVCQLCGTVINVEQTVWTEHVPPAAD